MATTYAAYYNIHNKSNEDSRRVSAASTGSASSAKSISSKIDKFVDFLAPRWPIYPAYTPTKPAHKERSVSSSEAASSADRRPSQVTPTYDSVLRRPLFHKAKHGNEATLSQKRASVSEQSRDQSKRPSVEETGLPASAQYFGMK